MEGVGLLGRRGMGGDELVDRWKTVKANYYGIGMFVLLGYLRYVHCMVDIIAGPGVDQFQHYIDLMWSHS